jgi:hypothetical protein
VYDRKIGYNENIGGTWTMALQALAQIEGTWDEVVRHASEFQGHRLRVLILPDDDTAKEGNTTGKYAARMQPLLAEISKTIPNEEEKALAEKDLQDFMDSMNENRLRDGAEPVF